MAQEWREIIPKEDIVLPSGKIITLGRTRTHKDKRLCIDGKPINRFSCDATIGSLHYEEIEGSGEWLDVDPSLVPSLEPGWDWEMAKSHWRLLIKNGGWIGIERGGVGFGFKLIGWTFLNIATKDYDAIRYAIYPTPIISGNELTWANIYPGVDYKLIVGPDGMGYSINVSQIARGLVPASPYPVADTFFVYVYQVLWQDCPYLADAESEDWLDDRDAPYEPRRGLWLVDALGKVKAYLPLGWALSVGDIEPIELKHRYVKRDASHYLLIGAKWDTLKGLPAGDIILNSNIDLGFFANG